MTEQMNDQGIDDLRFYATNGQPCYAKRHPTLGHWCGYVLSRTPMALRAGDHHYPDVDVHGGCTYYEPYMFTNVHGEIEVPFTHPAVHGRSHRERATARWVGFDCAHVGDVVPEMTEFRARVAKGMEVDMKETYRDLAYVILECERLATQVVAWQI